MKRTYMEVANEWQLWCEYADPAGLGTEEEWEAMSIEDRIGFLICCFGPENVNGL